MQVVLSLGADSAQAAYSAFSRRANELMLEGWHLDVDGCSETQIAVRREREGRMVEVTECYDPDCLAARPPSGLPPMGTHVDGDGTGNGSEPRPS
jgi:hypothetical protein